MILVLKKGADENKVESLKQQLKDMGLGLHLSDGANASLIGLIGDTTEVDAEWLGALDVVKICTPMILSLMWQEEKSEADIFR